MATALSDDTSDNNTIGTTLFDEVETLLFSLLKTSAPLQTREPLAEHHALKSHPAFVTPAFPLQIIELDQ